MAAVGVPIRTMQEWVGHKDIATTQIYADYSADPAQGAGFVERAFGASAEASTNSSTNLSETGGNSAQQNPLVERKSNSAHPLPQNS